MQCCAAVRVWRSGTSRGADRITTDRANSKSIAAPERLRAQGRLGRGAAEGRRSRQRSTQACTGRTWHTRHARQPLTHRPISVLAQDRCTRSDDATARSSASPRRCGRVSPPARLTALARALRSTRNIPVDVVRRHVLEEGIVGHELDNLVRAVALHDNLVLALVVLRHARARCEFLRKLLGRRFESALRQSSLAFCALL